MASPAMTKILMQRFGMSTVAAQVRSRKNGRSLELDVLAYSNSRQNEAYVIEVKSHLREDGLDQLRRTLREFREFFPEHADKKVYGILAAVDIPTAWPKRPSGKGSTSLASTTTSLRSRSPTVSNPASTDRREVAYPLYPRHPFLSSS
jgi:hypothetical protein